MTYEEFIKGSVLRKDEVDLFLDPERPSWAQFDPELGYILGHYMPRDGLDGSLTISTSTPNGARTSVIYAGRPCRLNTYGNSFTQCHQVSDQETWQEYLAAHLGEPVRNFGMGGYGVYQSYRRMVRTEQSPDAAEYVLLYIWGDDHHRSLLRCRHALTCRSWNHADGRMFHGNFWANLEMDLQSGEFVERDSMLPSPEALYRMTDPDFMVEALRDDWMLHMSAFCAGHIDAISEAPLTQLGEALGHPLVVDEDPDRMRTNVSRLRDAYAFAATRYIIDRAVDFAACNGKKLMFVIFCPRVTRELITTGQRYDQVIADYLRARELRHFDMNLVHAEDFKSFSLPLDEYLKRYFIGHYSPAGNHFFAFAIKDAIVDWLEPKPITYRSDQQARIDFQGYLPDL